VFTGIVKEVGEVESIATGSDGARLRISAGLASKLDQGDSVAVNGACLTAARVSDGSFEADVMNRTLELTTLGSLEPADRVNLELALRPADRLGGHVVQGHIDGTATVAGIEADGIARRLRLTLPGDLLSLVVERGSLAVEGVSLTVSDVGEDWAEVSLIPETLERTTLGGVGPGDSVNVECDVMARYVRRSIEVLSPLETETEQR
jgi:riboflavin synthase